MSVTNESVCFEECSMPDYMYNSLSDIIEVMKGTVANTKQSRWDIFSGGKYPLSLGVY